MHFFALAAALATLLPAALAVNINFYTDTVRCSGAVFSCQNQPQYQCCGNVPLEFGHSVDFTALPSGAEATAWGTVICSAPALGTVYGPGTRCLQSGGRWRVPGASWLRLPGHRDVDTEANCTSVNAFTYYDKDVMRTIKLEDGQAHQVAMFHAINDFEGLSKFPDY